jgi:hypothetical protein
MPFEKLFCQGAARVPLSRLKSSLATKARELFGCYFSLKVLFKHQPVCKIASRHKEVVCSKIGKHFRIHFFIFKLFIIC